jgi:hypothetical protein
VIPPIWETGWLQNVQPLNEQQSASFPASGTERKPDRMESLSNAMFAIAIQCSCSISRFAIRS